MNEGELAKFILQHVTPQMTDIEMARRVILEYLGAQGMNFVHSENVLVPHVQQKLVKGPGPIPEGMTIKPDLNEMKAQLAAYQALHLLHTAGALIVAGPLILGGQRGFTVENNRGTVPSPQIWIPASYLYYGLAIPFQGSMFRLASGDVYLSSLDETLLSSRVKRCLQEAIDAFRHGLYLSACMNAGAASESMWMELGRLVHQKVMATKELTDALTKNAVIAKVIDATWNALNYHAKATLTSIIQFDVDQRLFKEKADRLRDRGSVNLFV